MVTFSWQHGIEYNKIFYIAMNELKHIRIIYLISGYINHSLTKEENKELDNWRLARPSNAKLFQELLHPDYRKEKILQWNIDDTEVSLDRLKARRSHEPQKRRLWWPYAAAMSLLLATGLYYYQSRTIQPTDQVVLVNDVDPGNSKAILRLADGSTVQLDDTGNGTIAQQSGVSIVKTVDRGIIYQVNNTENTTSSSLYNTIEIPKGGKYQVRLPDGSEVWLNAASTLKYPVSFNEHGERRVELSGEAYFIVAHNKAQPFVVKTVNQEITVLGTEFNVNAYADENRTITTLLNGSVKVQSDNLAILKPGQQTMLSNGQLKVQMADTEAAAGWRNGMFLFHSMDMKSIMRQLERWYNVEVDIATIPDNQFYGEIQRDVKLSQVLSMLEATSGLKFKIEGRRITMRQ